MRKNKNRHIDALKILGNNIRKYRKAKQLSQEDLAFVLSSARNYIGCIERAEKVPGFEFILDIAQALDCKIEDLTEGISVQNPI